MSITYCGGIRFKRPAGKCDGYNVTDHDLMSRKHFAPDDEDGNN
jgi:hypothetical protein